MHTHQLDEMIGQVLTVDRAPCRLMVSSQLSALEAVASGLQACRSWPCLSVGRDLSERLLETPPEQRPMAIRDRLAAVLRASAPEPLVCTHIDLLFEPSLSLDPLMLFRRLAKINPLVVCWPGRYDGHVLSYAVPDHAHYRSWRNPDAAIIPLNEPFRP